LFTNVTTGTRCGAAWAVFVHRYTPLLYAPARRAGLSDLDAADLLQDVFASLSQQLPRFEDRPAQPLGAHPFGGVFTGRKAGQGDGSRNLSLHRASRGRGPSP
jgi:hypothetical protein